MVEPTEPGGSTSDAPAEPESLAVSLDTAPRPDGSAEHNKPEEAEEAAVDAVTQDQNQTELVATEEAQPISDLHADTENHTSSILISDDVEVADVPQDLQKTTADDQLPADVPETAISSDEPSLADLRQKVLDQRGTKAQLPPGWDDNEPAAPDATSSSSAAAAAAAEAIFSATTQVNSDSDSDSDTDSSSSSSSSSASDSSDDEDDDDAKAKAEMVSDYDSDEDGPSRRKEDAEDGGRGPTTKNEMQQTKASKLFGQVPFQQVPEELVSTITPLGKIHGRVQEVLVIAQHPENLPGSKVSGPSTSIPGPSTSYATTYASHNERQGPILDAGSLVCFGDGQVLGLVFETFGSLLSPLYSVILPESPPTAENPELETKYAKDTPIFFLPSRSTILRPAELRAQQGKPSDASNVHDEEPNEWEIDQMDFSDDEEEAEFKRRLKEKRKGGAGKRNANEDPSAAQRGGKSKRGKGRGGGGSGAQQQTRGASTAAATSAHALPARPNWQLDDPAGGDAGALQYGEGTGADGGNVPDGRSGNLRPYNDDAIASGDAPLQKAPPSAGLPPMPSSTAGTAAVQSQPPPPPSSSNGAPYQQQPHYQQQPSAAPAPPAGGAIHINPLFAHRFFGQGAPSPPSSSPGGYQQQQHAQPYAAYQQHQQQQYGSGQQSYPAYPQHHHQQQQQQQQYPMQGAQAGWNGHEQYGVYPQHQQHSYGSQGGQYYPYPYQQHPQQQQQPWSPYNVQQAPQSAYPYPSGGQGHGQGQSGSTYDPSRPS